MRVFVVIRGAVFQLQSRCLMVYPLTGANKVHLVAAGMKRERIVRRDFNHIPRQDFMRQWLGAVDCDSGTRVHGGSSVLCSTERRTACEQRN